MPSVDALARSGPDSQTKEISASNRYRYEHLLPYFAHDNYPPLAPFQHIDPGRRALGHLNPRAFLDNATKVTDLTPNLGTEVHGLDLTQLDSTGKDQLALEVIITSRRSLLFGS
jgi:sulfonate dioxygenase